MPKHPWLYNLVWLAYSGTDNGDRILNADFGSGRIHQHLNKGQRLLLLARCLLSGEVPSATDSEVSAGRMKNCQIKSVTYNIKYITLYVLPRNLRGKKIARPGVPSLRLKCLSYDAGEFTPNNESFFHFQVFPPKNLDIVGRVTPTASAISFIDNPLFRS